MGWDYDFIIEGEPASAKNQRRIVKIGDVSRLIKSKKALAYEKTFKAQCPIKDPLIAGDLFLWVDVWYASRRPDLACIDIIQDLLQDNIYANDRQAKIAGSAWNLDRENPRVRIRVKEMFPHSKTESFSQFDIGDLIGTYLEGCW
jgi:hypothetical protein